MEVMENFNVKIKSKGGGEMKHMNAWEVKHRNLVFRKAQVESKGGEVKHRNTGNQKGGGEVNARVCLFARAAACCHHLPSSVHA